MPAGGRRGRQKPAHREPEEPPKSWQEKARDALLKAVVEKVAKAVAGLLAALVALAILFAFADKMPPPIRNFLIAIALALHFPAPPSSDAYTFRTAMQEPCGNLIQLYKDVRARGIDLRFDPPWLERVEICRKTEAHGRSAPEVLADVLGRFPACFTESSTSAASITIRLPSHHAVQMEHHRSWCTST